MAISPLKNRLSKSLCSYSPILSPVDLNKINSPVYLSYYQIGREKIKRAAYSNYTRAEEGEICISFVVSSDGHISAVKLIEEKSSQSAYLRNIAFRSVQEASPFPKFPKELDYPQLTFNIVISFEIE
jgi:TonB family protein